ncbi:MAG: HAMP domain-containing sensor histidine kinase, partial [Alphaproteobacteria bacterium]|nr:HAMP domain-containing sensor histidine kinase [Alphaproteobacteria bacterium]
TEFGSAGIEAAGTQAASPVLAELGQQAGRLHQFRIIDETGLVSLATNADEVGAPAPQSPILDSAPARADGMAIALPGIGTPRALARARLPLLVQSGRAGILELTIDVSRDAAAVGAAFDHARTLAAIVFGFICLGCGGLFWGYGTLQVADRRTAAGQLAAARETVRTDREATSELLAFMSHKLRTPLNAIMGFAEAVKTERFGTLDRDTYRDYAAAIHASGVELMSALTDIIDLSNAHDEAPEPEDIDPVALAGQALEALAGEAATKGVRLGLVTQDAPAGLRADATLLMRMLTALMSNAIVQSGPGGRCRLTVTTAQDGAAIFQVSDSGITIDKGKAVRALALSGRLESCEAKPSSGAGLALAKNLAERQGGSMELIGRIGGGMCARVRFPGSLRTDLEPDPAAAGAV